MASVSCVPDLGVAGVLGVADALGVLGVVDGFGVVYALGVVDVLGVMDVVDIASHDLVLCPRPFEWELKNKVTLQRGGRHVPRLLFFHSESKWVAGGLPAKIKFPPFVLSGLGVVDVFGVVKVLGAMDVLSSVSCMASVSQKPSVS